MVGRRGRPGPLQPLAASTQVDQDICMADFDFRCRIAVVCGSGSCSAKGLNGEVGRAIRSCRKRSACWACDGNRRCDVVREVNDLFKCGTVAAVVCGFIGAQDGSCTGSTEGAVGQHGDARSAAIVRCRDGIQGSLVIGVA